MGFIALKIPWRKAMRVRPLLRHQSNILKNSVFSLYRPWRHQRASGVFCPTVLILYYFFSGTRRLLSLIISFQRVHCCKTVVDREGIERLKGNRGNRETRINPLIFKSKPESQTKIKGLWFFAVSYWQS